MKCSEMVTRYEHKNVIAIMTVTVKEPKTEVSIQLHKRVKAPNESHWKGSLDEIRELNETVDAILAVCSTQAQTEAEHAQPTEDPAGMETLNAGLGLSAEPPKPGEGDIVVQMTIEQFRDILDASNAILESKTAEAEAELLARLVNKALGGRTVY
jgi:hypothetical protein